MHRTSNITDEALMAKVKHGQLQYMAALFERYQVKLYNFFLRLTYSASVSEDLTQNVFERMLRYRYSYQETMPFKAWMYQIARNIKADYFKHKKDVVADFSVLEQISSQKDAPIHQQIEAQETLQSLAKAMTHLSEEQKEILVLTRFQKMKYAEVATLLNCSEGAVKVKVHRAIKQLRSHFYKIAQQ